MKDFYEERFSENNPHNFIKLVLAGLFLYLLLFLSIVGVGLWAIISLVQWLTST